MLDVTTTTTDATAAPSAAEPIVLEPKDAGPKATLTEMTPSERLEWRKTGDRPSKKVSTYPASSAAAPAVQAVSTETIAPKSAPETDEYKARTAARINELLENARKATERAERAERALATAQQPPAADVQLAASSTATADDPEPDPEKYADLTKYFKDQAAWAARDVLRTERKAQAVREQTARVEADTARMRTELSTRWEATAAKHGDFLTVATGPTVWDQGSVIDRYILGVKDGFEVLYHLQKNPAEAKRINGLADDDQLVELALISHKSRSAPPVKLITTAPDPSPELGVRSTDTASEAKRAMKKRDVRGYIDAANREEMASKGR